VENDLIRKTRPKFNRAGVWPKSARYVRVEVRDYGIRLEWVADAAVDGLAIEAGPDEAPPPFRPEGSWKWAPDARDSPT